MVNITSIKVLGSGCKNCAALLANTKEAIQTTGLNLEPEYITDMSVIASTGAMSMPALMINDIIVSQGKVCKPKDVEKLLQKAMA